MSEAGKEIIVVAKEGYSVLLNINGQTLDIDSYCPVNLSKIFSERVIEQSTSLAAHLREGHLIYYEGQELPENSNESSVNKLRQSEAKHIEVQFKQAARDATRTHMELETRTDLNEATRKRIQEQVQKGKDEILQTDQQVEQAVHDVNVPVESQTAMTPDELSLKVSMDVNPDTFKQKQETSKKLLDANEEAGETRAEQEIAKQESDEEQENV